MTECWRYGVLFCNSFMIFGVYYFMEIPVSLQNEMMNRYHPYNGTNNTSIQTDCKVCLCLGEVRYNLIFSTFKLTSLVVCLPSGLVIDRLGNSRSVVLFSVLPLIGSVMFALGATSHAPVTTPTYIMMVAGYSLLAFGDGSLRFVQTRVISYSFPEATLITLALSSFGHCGQGVSLFLTPYIATTVGFMHSVWLGPVVCGFGVMFAVILAFLLQLKTSRVAVDNQKKKIMTLKELWALPGTYWMFIISIAFANVCWLIKQANLPDFLMLRHGYTMIEASRITGIAPFGVALCPLICLALEKIDCDGIMTSTFQSWMLICYALLGFCPDFNIIVIAVADGIGISIITLLVDLCPAPYIGTLGGLMYSVRNAVTALTFVASGYILERSKTTDVEVELDGYNHLFLMLILMTSTGVVCGAVMNVMDCRKACALNSRLARWRQSNTETIGLISMAKPSSQYSGIDDVNDNTINDDDSSVKSATCEEN